MTVPTPFDPFIDAIAEAVAAKTRPAIAQAAQEAVKALMGSDNMELWGRAQSAGHLGLSLRRFDEISKMPGFPKRIDRPGQPRWLASDIRSYGLGRVG